MLQRYLLKEIGFLYLMGILLFVGLISFDFLSSSSGVLLRAGTPVTQVFMLVVYNLPRTLTMSAPLGLVFAVLIALARWIRQSELKASFAAGVPPLKLLISIAGLGLLVSLLLVWALGWLRPISEESFDALWYRVSTGGDSSASVLRDQTFAPEGLGLYFAGSVYPAEAGKGNRLEAIRIIEPGGAVWSADQGIWVDGAWKLYGAKRVDPDGKVTVVEDAPLPFPKGVEGKETSSSFSPYGRSTLPELHKLAKADPTAVFWLSRRYSDAFSALILALVSGAMGLHFRQTSWAFISVAGIILGYWTLWVFSQRMAEYGSLSGIGAWIPNIVFGLVAMVAAWRLR